MRLATSLFSACDFGRRGRHPIAAKDSRLPPARRRRLPRSQRRRRQPSEAAQTIAAQEDRRSAAISAATLLDPVLRVAKAEGISGPVAPPLSPLPAPAASSRRLLRLRFARAAACARHDRIGGLRRCGARSRGFRDAPFRPTSSAGKIDGDRPPWRLRRRSVLAVRFVRQIRLRLSRETAAPARHQAGRKPSVPNVPAIIGRNNCQIASANAT